MKYSPVKGYEKTHVVSEDGRVFKSLKNGSQIELKPRVNRNNATPLIYLIVDDKKVALSLAKIVAEAFIPNKENYKWVIHKDGNNSNNRVENLAWSKTKPGRNEKIQCSNGKIYNSIVEASDDVNLAVSQIRICLSNGRIKNGLSFSYVDKQIELKESKVEDLPDEIWKPLRETNEQYMISNMGRVKTVKRQNCNLTQEKLVTQGITDKRASIKTRTYLKDGTVIRRFYTVINEVMRHFGEYDPDLVKLYNKDGDISNCALSNIGVKIH